MENQNWENFEIIMNVNWKAMHQITSGINWARNDDKIESLHEKVETEINMKMNIDKLI